MNGKQRKVLIAVCVVVVAIIVFPPFRVPIRGGFRSPIYSFLFTPPGSGSVDVFMLITQWLGVLIVGGIIFFVLKDK